MWKGSLMSWIPRARGPAADTVLAHHALQEPVAGMAGVASRQPGVFAGVDAPSTPLWAVGKHPRPSLLGRGWLRDHGPCS